MLDEMRQYIDVKKIGVAIIEYVNKTKDPLSRFACRFIPIDLICKANKFDEFKVLATPIINKYFHKRPSEFDN
jgi:beta-galactosidase GanA